MASMASLESIDSDSGSSSESDSDQEKYLCSLVQERKEMRRNFRASFCNMAQEKRDSILSFLTTINREIACLGEIIYLQTSRNIEFIRKEVNSLIRVDGQD